MSKKNQILSIVILSILTTSFFYSCRKEILSEPFEYKQNVGFFTRSSELIHLNISEGTVRSNANGTPLISKQDVIDTILNLLKEEDLKKQFINKIVNKFGYAQWNYSLILRNDNGLKTVITPIIDSANKVTSLILAYQSSSAKADFKIIDRKIKQTKLPYYGDKEGKTFTQASLEGIFQSLEKKINQVSISSSKSVIKNNGEIQSHLVQYSLECWYYVAKGDMTITISNTQCSLSMIITPEVVQNIQWDESLTQSSGTYSAPSPPPVNPNYECNCNCPEENTDVPISEAKLEPKWGQLGTVSSIILEMTKVAFQPSSDYLTLNFKGKLEKQSKHFEGNRMFTRDQHNNLVDRSDSKKIDRYIYTYDLGWIDMHHFFYAAFLCEKYNSSIAFAVTTDAEAIQLLKNNESAFSYEDIPSNVAGINFYRLYADEIKNGNNDLESAISKFFLTDHSATNPENAPNYDFIPHVIDGFFAKNYSTIGLTGGGLYIAAKEAFCKKPTVTKEAIKEAHRKISHSAN